LDKREDKPNDSTELDKGREKITQDELQAIEREKACVPFIYLPILEREKVCVSFIYLPILEREKVSKKTVHYLWCFGPCGSSVCWSTLLSFVGCSLISCKNGLKT
jgi:hypothetical protein